MTTLVRRTPYAVDTLFDDLMKGFLVRPVPVPDEAVQIRLDIRENDQGYTVHADLPGVLKEDIHVHVDGSTVTLEAEIRRQPEPQEGEKVVHSERCFGKLRRSFSLPLEIDDAQARARLDNGVLELVLPKRVAATQRRLVIE